MRIFLTGGTGFIGSAVLNELVRSGHDVAALVRSDAAAGKVETAGARAVRGELTDGELLAREAASADGVIHAASPGDATNAAVDTAVLDAVLSALSGSGKPYVHTGGTWIHGSGDDITEETPPDPPPIVAWRPAINDRVRVAAADGVRSVIVAPGNVYGYSKGIPALLLNSPKTGGDEPALLYPDRGQHFSNVYIEDIAALYALALSEAPPGSYYLGTNDESPSIGDLAVAASRARGLDGQTEPEAPDATRERLGPMTDALLLDQRVTSRHARSLGWTPAGPSLVEEMSTGSYSRVRPTNNRGVLMTGSVMLAPSRWSPDRRRGRGRDPEGGRPGQKIPGV